MQKQDFIEFMLKSYKATTNDLDSLYYFEL